MPNRLLLNGPGCPQHQVLATPAASTARTPAMQSICGPLSVLLQLPHPSSVVSHPLSPPLHCPACPPPHHHHPPHPPRRHRGRLLARLHPGALLYHCHGLPPHHGALTGLRRRRSRREDGEKWFPTMAVLAGVQRTRGSLQMQPPPPPLEAAPMPTGLLPDEGYQGWLWNKFGKTSPNGLCCGQVWHYVWNYVSSHCMTHSLGISRSGLGLGQHANFSMFWRSSLPTQASTAVE